MSVPASKVARVTEPSYLAAVRESYDTVAADYAQLVMSPAELDPLSRSMLAVFAEVVRSADRGPVADLGCGPGKVTAHLADLGVRAFGVDRSPKMIEVAQQAYPSLKFTVGSMTALAIGDDELGGILAYYSTHHTPPELLPVVFAEFHRTLAPGGRLMMAGYGRRRTCASDACVWRPSGVLRVPPASTGSHRLAVGPGRTRRHLSTAAGTRRRIEEDGRHLSGTETRTAHGVVANRRPDAPSSPARSDDPVRHER